MAPKILTGADNFRKLVSSNGLSVDLNRLFIDKTLLIQAFLDAAGETILITRPRRWGKTLNLSMLQHFFAKTVDGQPTAGLFENLNISTAPEHMAQQGQSPVIFVSFKDLKGDTFETILDKIKRILSELYQKHEYILDALCSHDPCFQYKTEISYKNQIAIFERVISQQSTESELINALAFLSQLLAKFHGTNCYVFVDEYDNAINNALSEDFQLVKKLTDFFSELFGIVFKGNPYLKKGLLTGILRIAKANIFSGLNNLSEYTVLDSQFNEYYGFTEKEVSYLLSRSNIGNQTEIKAWYNGYRSSENTLYNPWSIMRCIAAKGKLETYWVDTANPILIKTLLIERSSVHEKQMLRHLMSGKSLTLPAPVKKYVSTEQIRANRSIIWSLLVHTGYLTLTENDTKTENNTKKQEVMIPNREIEILLQEQVADWFNAREGMNLAANYILVGEIGGFLNEIRQEIANPAYAARIFSGGRGSSTNTIELREFVYHFLLMTQLRCINTGEFEQLLIAEPYIGMGHARADFMILNEVQKLCIVGELKVSADRSKLQHDAEHNALAQIQTKGYGKTHASKGYQLICLGLAFKGLDFAAAYTLPRSEQVHRFPE